MIDVHVLVRDGDNPKWLGKCIKSLINEPVNIIIQKGIEGDTAKARELAFKKSTAKYVSFVDSDDMVAEGVYQRMLEMIEGNPDAVAVYSDEVLINQNDEYICHGWSVDPQSFLDSGYKQVELCNVGGQYMHHVVLLRKEAVDKCLPLKCKRMPEVMLMHELSKLGDILHLEEIGYMWRIHNDNTIFKYSADEYEEAEGYLQAL